MRRGDLRFSIALSLLFQSCVVLAEGPLSSQEETTPSQPPKTSSSTAEKEAPKKDEKKDDKNDEKKLFEGNLSLTTNYVSRGISNSDNKPAVQGGLTLNDTLARTGAYLNVWGSSIRFPDVRGKTAYVELDPSIGVTNKVGDNFNYNIYGLRYTYPKAKGLDYNELIATAQFYFLTTFIGYSPDVYATGKDGTYVNIGFKYDLPEDMLGISGINISGGIGRYKLPTTPDLHTYVDYNLQVSKSFELNKTFNLLIALEWTDTNRKSREPSAWQRSHVIGTATLNF